MSAEQKKAQHTPTAAELLEVCYASCKMVSGKYSQRQLRVSEDWAIIKSAIEKFEAGA